MCICSCVSTVLTNVILFLLVRILGACDVINVINAVVTVTVIFLFQLMYSYILIISTVGSN